MNMGTGFEVSLPDQNLESTLEGKLEAEFISCLIRQTATILAGKKPSAIFNFIPKAHGVDVSQEHKMYNARNVVSYYASLLKEYGFCMRVCAEYDDKICIFAYRPNLLKSVLSRFCVLEVLCQHGYTISDTDICIDELIERLALYHNDRGAISVPINLVHKDLNQQRGFPHEIGLFLGYPVEDVVSFISSQGTESVSVGQWKVYHNNDRAQRQFEVMRRWEEDLLNRFNTGSSFKELLTMSYKQAV